MSEKTWRLSKEEFIKKADAYFDRKIMEIKVSVNTMKGDHYKKVSSALTKLKNAENSNASDDIVRKLKADLVCCGGGDWSKFSLYKKETPNDIVFMLLLNEVFDCSLVAYTYICEFSVLSEDLIKDMIFIESELFSFSYWDDKHVDLVNEIFQKYGEKKDCIDTIRYYAENDTEYSKDFQVSCKNIINKCIKNKEAKISSAKKQISNMKKNIKNTEFSITGFENGQLQFIDNFCKNMEEGRENIFYKKEISLLLSSLETVVIGFPNEHYFNSILSRNKSESNYEFIKSIPTLCRKELNLLHKRLNSYIESEKLLQERLIDIENSDISFFMHDKLDWFFISKNQNLPDEFISKYSCLIRNLDEDASSSNIID